ncbi:MAG: chromate transporter [Clostridia bacterium]|nr:chromate transporter [Clostridia bacterium]
MSTAELCLQLFLTFLKIGAFTFGGGYAMLPLMEQEVLDHGWLTLEEIVNFIAVSESTPGPFAINMATYIGTETAGFLGAVCATLGVVTPSFIIILIVARFFMKFKDNFVVRGLMTGLKPAVIGLIAAAILSVGAGVFFPLGFSFGTFITYQFITSFIIFIGMLVLAFKKLHPIFVVLISAALGIGVGFLGRLL